MLTRADLQLGAEPSGTDVATISLSINVPRGYSGPVSVIITAGDPIVTMTDTASPPPCAGTPRPIAVSP